MNSVNTIGSYKVITVDVIIVLLLIYAVPALSHLTSIPFYLLDPMRVLVLGSYLYLRGNKSNALFLAITLPLVSFLLSGHPVFPKNLLISFELAINILLIDMLVKKSQYIFFAVLLSILISKLVYYLVKWLLIMGGLLDTGIVDTNIWIQLCVACVLSFLFSKYLNSKA